MPTGKRIAAFAWHRLRGLPRGTALLRYLANEARFQVALRQKSERLPYPNSIMLELTNCCNLDCITCPREYAYGRKMDIGNMDFDAAKKLLDEIGIYLDRLGLSGLGETLLYPKLEELLSYVRAMNPGVNVFISSNLSLPNAADLFGRIGRHINTLQVSIDGTGEVFEAVRKKADYGRFLDNLKKVSALAREKSVSVKANMVVFAKNYRRMAEVVALAADHGIEEIFLARINPVSIDAGLFDENLYTSESFRQEYARAQAVARERGVSVFHAESMGSRTVTLCRYPWNSIYVTWDGYMVPCCAKPFPKELNFGNVFEKGFLACLNSSGFIDFRRTVKAGKTPPFCKGCC